MDGGPWILEMWLSEDLLWAVDIGQEADGGAVDLAEDGNGR